MIKVTNVLNEFDGNNMDTLSEIISVGDLTTHTITIEESISHDTSIYPTFNSTYYVTLSGVTASPTKIKFNAYYLMNSFVAGQSISITLTIGGASTTLTRTISSVDYNNFELTVPNIVSQLHQTYGNTGAGVNKQCLIYTTSLRNNLILNVGLNNRPFPYLNNKLASIVQGGYPSFTTQNRTSLIDESICRLHLPVNLNTMAVTDVENFELVSFGSGVGKVEATIERLTDVNAYTRKWEIVLNITNCVFLLDEGITGDIQNFFDQSLIIYTDTEWYTTSNIIPYPSINAENPYVLQHDLTTIKFLDDPYGVPNLSQVLPVAPSFNNGIYYNAESDEFTVTFGSVGPAFTDLYIGASFVPTVDSYYKSKNDYQTSLSMVLPTFLASVGTFTSELNPDGAGYDLEITSLTNPTATTIEVVFKIIPNGDFTTLLTPDTFNKNFIVWGKLGHTCHTIYRGEALKKPKLVTPFNDINSGAVTWCRINGDKTTEFLQVNDSYDTTALTPLTYPLFNTEDHFQVNYALLVPQLKRFSNFKTELVFGLYTDILNSYVVLDQFTIDGERPYNELTGKTTFNATTPNQYNLPNFVNGLQLRNVTANDTLTEQYLNIISTFQINWRYWLTQTGLYDFLIAQGLTTKDFIDYIKDSLNARINNNYFFFVRTSFEDDDNQYYHFTQIWDVLNYDEQLIAGAPTTGDEWQGSGVIKYYTSSGLEVPNLIINELMTVEVIVTTGQVATTDSWGNITIEQSEQNLRWMMSSNYANITFNNVGNPIQPIVGETKLKRDVTDTNEITYTCLIDCSLLADNQYFKITLKHYNIDLLTEQTRLKFDTRTSILESESTGAFSLDSSDDCTDYFDVFGYDADPNDIEKNDTTLVLGYKLTDSTVVTFKILDENDMDISHSFTIFTSTNDSKLKYAYVDWLTVLNNEGAQTYKVYIVYTTGITVNELLYGTYNARFWNVNMLTGSVKIRSYFNSIINTNKISFDKNTALDLNFNENKIIWDDVRVKGFFGNRQPKTVVENIISSSNNILATFKENLNEYTFSSVPLLTNHSNHLIDFTFLNGLFYTVWDYNKFNHNLYSGKNIALKEVLDITPKGEHTNKAEIQAVFNDYFQANKMSY